MSEVVFHLKAIRVSKMDKDIYRRELTLELEKQGTRQCTELRKCVRTWTHKPEFETLIDASGGQLTVLTGATGEHAQIFAWVNEGTKAHIITARRAPLLRFRVGGKPKTQPGWIGSRRGKPGTAWRSVRVVLHPGTQARNFTGVITSRLKPVFVRRVEKALSRVSKQLFQTRGGGGNR